MTKMNKLKEIALRKEKRRLEKIEKKYTTYDKNGDIHSVIEIGI
jgi:hypothetical protein